MILNILYFKKEIKIKIPFGLVLIYYKLEVYYGFNNQKYNFFKA